MAEPEAGHRASSRALAVLTSTAFSLLLHGSVLAAALFWVERQPGAVAPPTQAVSIELFETQVLEAITTAPTLEATASPASVQSDPGDSAASAVAPKELAPVAPSDEIAAREPQPDTLESAAPEGVAVLKGALEAPEPAGPERSARETAREAQPEPRPEEKKPVKTARLTEPDAEREKERQSKKKGAAHSRATTGKQASTGHVSASAGSAINYAALVRARVAARKPAGNGRRGTVVVSFGVTRSGGLSFASIARSSGDSSLDRNVLAAVRGAGPFPTPPPGAQLRFAIPFYFR
ncbi:MAG: TonB family protein [Hyphomicrobium sp.]